MLKYKSNDPFSLFATVRVTFLSERKGIQAATNRTEHSAFVVCRSSSAQRAPVSTQLVGPPAFREASFGIVVSTRVPAHLRTHKRRVSVDEGGRLVKNQSFVVLDPHPAPSDCYVAPPPPERNIVRKGTVHRAGLGILRVQPIDRSWWLQSVPNQFPLAHVKEDVVEVFASFRLLPQKRRDGRGLVLHAEAFLQYGWGQNLT